MIGGNISFRFDKDRFYSDVVKKAAQEAIIRGIVSWFNLPELHSKKILIYFSINTYRNLRSLGRTFVIEIEDHKKEIEENYLDVFLDDTIDNYNYFIVLSRDMYLNDDHIFKTFTIAHEIQHVVQHISHICDFLANRIFFYYFRLVIEDQQVFYKKQMEIPMEYDARREAKVINCKMFTKSIIDHYLDEKIFSGIEGEEVDYKFLKEISIEEKYDFAADSDMYWENYQSDIETQIKRIRMKKARTGDEAALMRAYELLVQKCPGMKRIEVE